MIRHRGGRYDGNGRHRLLGCQFAQARVLRGAGDQAKRDQADRHDYECESEQPQAVGQGVADR
jgi:hypothetical protein